jgi:hypothetical protein
MSPVLIGLIIAGVGLLLGVVGLVVRNKAGYILAVPVSKTGDIARVNGLASCQGAVRANQALLAPCTNMPCVYFELRIEAKVKEKRGGQTTTKWKKLATHRQGLMFAVDDGSGSVLVPGQNDLDGDLTQTFVGPLPGGPGLGVLAGYVTNAPRLSPHEEILEYKVTEKLIRTDATVFALGAVQNGQLTGGAKKLLVSTRGRDALVGSAKTRALALMIAGGLAVAGGGTVAVLRPGEAPACGALVDSVRECAISSGVVVEEDRVQADGLKKHERFKRQLLEWKVTKGTRYELAARDPRKRNANPVLQVENEIGLPMNIDFGLAIGAGAYSTKTRTAKLSPGNYRIYVFSLADGPSKLALQISEAGETASK